MLNHRNVKKFNRIESDVKEMVKSNDKQRFVLKEEDGVLYIKAAQGHSMKDIKVELKKVENASQYPIIVHGTYSAAWPAIKTQGLSKMSRNHIHFAIGEYGSSDVISGMRKTSEVMVYIDLESAMKDGIEFFESENHVILTEGKNGILPPKYFTHVISNATGKPFDSLWPNERKKISKKEKN